MRIGGNPLPAAAAAGGGAAGAAGGGNCIGGICICGADMEGGVKCGACMDGGVIPAADTDGPVTEGADICGFWNCGAWKSGTAGKPPPPALGAAGGAGACGGAGGNAIPPPGAGAPPPRITIVNSPGPAGVAGSGEATGAEGIGPRKTWVAPSNEWFAAGVCGTAGGV